MERKIGDMRFFFLYLVLLKKSWQDISNQRFKKSLIEFYISIITFFSIFFSFMTCQLLFQAIKF